MEFSFLQEKIDELNQKIKDDERDYRNETNPAQVAKLEKIISEDKVTLRGYVQQLAQRHQQQLLNQQQYGQNVGGPQVETAHSEGYSNYSPMSFSGHATPRSRTAAHLHDDEFVHYTKLLKSALHQISPDFHIKFSQGNLLIIHQGLPFVTFRDVSTSLHLKNIYYLIKVMREEPYSWNDYIRRHGIPTLVQATKTGFTPPTIDDEFDVNEYDSDSFQFDP